MTKNIVAILLTTLFISSCTKPNKKDDSKNLSASEATTVMLNALNTGEPPEKAFDYDAFVRAIDAGADVNGRSEGGLTAIYLATIGHAYLGDGHPDKANFLKAMKILISKGANVNATSYGGSTPLMHAVHRAYTGAGEGAHEVPKIKEAYDVLLSATNPKPDLDMKNMNGSTALSYLVGYQELEVAKMLVDRGADYRVINSDGKTLIHSAMSSKSTEMFEYILSLFGPSEQKEWANKADLAGRTPLMEASNSVNAKTVQLLLEKYSAEPNLIDVEDETALGLAMYKQSVAKERGFQDVYAKAAETIKVLKKYGAKVVALNPDRILCDRSNGYPTNFERVKKIINQCGVTDADQLMKLLPRPYKSNYTLFFASQSLQEANASHASPRVIMMGRTGQTLIALAGDKQKPGYNVVEMIEFKNDSKKFEFREIDLNKSGESRFSAANPNKCSGCHKSTTPRPNWYSWMFWPGAYFGEQATQYAKELEFYEEYKENVDSQKREQKGIYRHLLANGRGGFETNVGPVFGPQIKNTKMDELVGHYVTEMAMQQMISSAKLKPYKYAVLAAMSCRQPIEDFIPERVQQSLPRKYSEIYKETLVMNRKEFLNRVAVLKKFVPGAPNGHYIKDILDDGDYGGGRSFEMTRVSKLRYILEGLGVPMDWSTIPGENTYVFLTLSGIEVNLWKKWLKPEGDEARVYKIYEEGYKKLNFKDTVYTFFSSPDFPGENPPFQDSRELCTQLKELSLGALN